MFQRNRIFYNRKQEISKCVPCICEANKNYNSLPQLAIQAIVFFRKANLWIYIDESAYTQCE